MLYDIQSQSDCLNGASLVIRIPEDELDKKALYTIQSDKPKYILPFHYRSIDGQIEIVYQIGAQSKLLYLSGSRSQSEYISLWSGLLAPLINCGDWFMRPYSFVLSVEYLYYDKNQDTVCYVYIPSVKDCSQHASIKEMAAEFSKHISVADADLENMILRAIMRDFNPADLLQMLEKYCNNGSQRDAVSNDSYGIAGKTPVALWSETKPIAGSIQTNDDSNSLEETCPDYGDSEPQEKRYRTSSGDIFINIPSKSNPSWKEKGIPVDRKDTAGNKEKEPKRQNSARGFFGGRKDTQQEMQKGTALKPQKEARGPVCVAEPDFAPTTDTRGLGKGGSTVADVTKFRFVGNAILPPVIDVLISVGEIFTIGRYDAVTGTQQSSFEFDKKTKAVSRRHAAIERGSEKYSIIDLSSSAGTFLNGTKLPPNTPCELENGCRVSFGNAGADYVWEE